MMKRSLGVSLLTIISLLSLTARAGAAPIGPPGSTVGAGKIGLTGEFDFMIDRDLDGFSEEANSLRLMAKGSVGLSDRVDLDLRLGFGDIEFEGVFRADPDPDVRTTLDGEFGLVYGAGIRVTWLDLKDIKIGSVTQILVLHNDAEDERVPPALGILPPPIKDFRTSWTEVDVAIGISLETLRFIVPYIGVNWSTVDGNAILERSFVVAAEPPVMEVKEENPVGVFLGFEFRPTEVKLAEKKLQTFKLGTELRLANETSFSFTVGYVF